MSGLPLLLRWGEKDWFYLLVLNTFLVVQEKKYVREWFPGIGQQAVKFRDTGEGGNKQTKYDN